MYCRTIPLLFAFPSLNSLLLPICLPFLTWNLPCCDRIRPPRSRVARKLIFPFPSPCSYTPHSKIPTPRGFPDPNIHSLGRHLALTRSSTVRSAKRCCHCNLGLMYSANPKLSPEFFFYPVSRVQCTLYSPQLLEGTGYVIDRIQQAQNTMTTSFC